MGRTLSDAHLDALIGYWDERLRDCDPTGPALRRLLRPETANQAVPDAATARQFARAAAALRAAEGESARRAWILSFPVARGPDLLIDSMNRGAGRRWRRCATVPGGTGAGRPSGMSCRWCSARPISGGCDLSRKGPAAAA